jgi:3-oxoacyl-[acyl-carrier protein] reductase
MDLGLSDKTAFVLGASSGLGLAIAKCLAAEKTRVVMSSRKGDRLNLALADLRQINSDTSALPIDLQSSESMNAGEVSIRELRPDILVCNSGGPPPGSAAVSDLGNWRQQFDVMVLSQIRCIRAALPSMVEKRWGRILVIASSGIFVPIPNLAISNSLRSALVAFAKTLSAEVAGSGVTVNTIVPGRIATPRVAQLDQAAADREKTDPASVKQKSLQAIPAGRYGDPAEFANVATFLVSERASYVTGQTTRVDGGFIRSV